nr:hypothetical protein [Tanacetum cinerariifolium]
MSDMTACLNELSYIPLNNEQNEQTQVDIGETSNDPNQAKCNQFKELYASANEELYPGCDYVTRLVFMSKFTYFKAKGKLADSIFNEMLEFFQNVFPTAKGYKLPPSYYAIKKTFKMIGLGYESIHACVNDCFLFRGDANKYVHFCPVCNTSRWKDSNTPGKKVPKKVLRYFSIIPRLQRLYKSSHTTKEMTWHATGKCTEPEPINVRLGLAADGFNLFGNLSQSYSMWSVILTTYNLPPWLCMKESYFMLTLLIPGPKSPSKDIDVYLRPLIDDLKVLWVKPGVETIDVAIGLKFNMRTMVQWTINDFPGWSGQGYKACPTSKPEGSIAEGYIAEEALTFSSHYFRDVTTKFNCSDHNVDCPPPTCQLQVFKSLCKSIGLRSVISIDHQELKKVIWYVLHNSPKIDTYQAKFKIEFPNKDMKEEFPGWFGKQTPISVNSCVVNGVRFIVHNRDERRTTQNSGICSPGPDGEMYYGQLEQILEFSYLSFKTVLYRVKWFDTSNKGHVDEPPDIIDVVDEDDDIIEEEDPIPHDLADSDDEDLVNLNIDDGVNMSTDVARGHGGNDGGDDRPPPYQVPTSCGGCLGNQGKGTRKPNLGGRRAGRLYTRQETQKLELKTITDKSSPVLIWFEVDDRETLMPLGDHAAYWANYLGELVRELPLHYPSWRQMPPERKAGVVAKIGMSDMTTCLNDLSYIPLNNEQNEPTQGDIGETSNDPTKAKRNKFKELYASANEELFPGCDYVTRLDFMAKFTYFKVKGKDIDVYFRSLIDDLKDLWAKTGVETIDVATSQKFNMRAMVLWIINDFLLEVVCLGGVGDKRDDTSSSAKEFAGKLSSIQAKFKSLRGTLKYKVLMRKLLNSVPKKFLSTVASIKQYQEIDTMKFEEAVERITAFEERLKSQDEPENNYQNKLLLASSNNQGGGRGHGRNFTKNKSSYGKGTSHRSLDKRKLRCYECGEHGHFAKECMKWKNKKKEKEQEALLISDDE